MKTYFVVIRFYAGRDADEHVHTSEGVEHEIHSWLASLNTFADLVHVEESGDLDMSVLRDPPFEDFES
jgi:hypothetical protein